MYTAHRTIPRPPRMARHSDFQDTFSSTFGELLEQEINYQQDQPKLVVVGPVDLAERGNHVSIAFEHGYALVQAMIECGVVGDFRAPDLMCFGFAPLYTRYQQIWDTIAMMKSCLQGEVWRAPEYNLEHNQAAAVT